MLNDIVLHRIMYVYLIVFILQAAQASDDKTLDQFWVYVYLRQSSHRNGVTVCEKHAVLTVCGFKNVYG